MSDVKEVAKNVFLPLMFLTKLLSFYPLQSLIRKKKFPCALPFMKRSGF